MHSRSIEDFQMQSESCRVVDGIDDVVSVPGLESTNPGINILLPFPALICGVAGTSPTDYRFRCTKIKMPRPPFIMSSDRDFRLEPATCTSGEGNWRLNYANEYLDRRP
jgi:hypothetical protein